ncbi:MAG: DNA primase [Leptospirales bacterium]|nr:DNA primase [Leptospirales bacterium]
MSRDPKEFEISKLLSLANKEKYATTVAAFEVIDKLEQIEIPKKYTNRKPAVKAMIALSDGIVQYDYIEDSVRQALEEELHGPEAAIGQPAELVRARVPVVEESDEDLAAEDIGEIEPAGKLDEDLEEGEGVDADEDDDDDDDDDDADDDDDDDDDDEDEVEKEDD